HDSRDGRISSADKFAFASLVLPIATTQIARPPVMKLSRTVAYALQATLQLAENNSHLPVPSSQLAAQGHMPERFLLQILRHLVTHGILHSTRGVDGGYSLDRKPEDISLLDVIEAIDGPLNATLPANDSAEESSSGLR